MNREETKEAIKVMQHYADGGEVEASGGDGWHRFISPGAPSWNWVDFEYRIKEEPMSIDWSHLRDDIIAVAADSYGNAYAHTTIPSKWYRIWHGVEGGAFPVNHIASFRRGTVPWDRSLIIRPGYGEGKDG